VIPSALPLPPASARTHNLAFRRLSWQIALFALVYGLTAQIGLNYSSTASNVTLIWPPSGLALFVVLRFGWRLWPGIVLGDLLGNAGTGAPLLAVLGISVGNIVETLVVAVLLVRFCGFHPGLDRARDVLALLVVGSGGAVLSAVFGPTSLALAGAFDPALFGTVFLQWVMGDATGVIVFGPLLLAWTGWRPSRPAPAVAAEAAVLLVTLLVVCEAVFGGLGIIRSGYYPAALALFPLAVWAALRFGLRGATAVTLVVSIAAVWGTVDGRGPFVEAKGFDSLVRWWVFANVITVTSLLLAASRAERHRAEADLAAQRDFVSAILDVQGALVAVLDRNGSVLRANRAFEALTGFTADEVRGRRFCELFVAPHERDKVEGHLEMLRLGLSQRVRYDAGLPRRQGDPLLVSWSNTALRAGRRQLSHIILTGIDITERTQAASALRAARRDLEGRVRERTRELAATNAELEAEIGERRRLEQAIIEVAEHEQMRIGQELHDGLGQQLTAVAFLAEVLARKLSALAIPETADAARIEQLVSAAVSQTRQLARGLAPVDLDAEGLMAALEDLATTVRDVFGIDCLFHCAAPVPVHDSALAINLYRIAQEAVTNAVKHAAARHVLIELSHREACLALTVTDDGRGLDAARPAGDGMGLRIMHHRAHVIGAGLALDSTPGSGVAVRVTLPLATPAAHAMPERAIA
jgi:PAS domain S-box-containing protein